ncbi:hypothetical protein CPB83DRAFT_852462 [Crepidotus variabilis]|uniref:Uncharacterized protein n=1 Tax=Crepidotus variabilis TaxID=179855 RepID=A0A9P6EID9_9AGAR|nr:hypothetical protein CPB83DRAFT_852462 [Crepidotus variabilis]
MRLAFKSVATIMSLLAVVSASALPQDTPDPEPTPVRYYCNGPLSLKCPDGYRCCGPIVVGKGGICYKGPSGVCPL